MRLIQVHMLFLSYITEPPSTVIAEDYSSGTCKFQICETSLTCISISCTGALLHQAIQQWHVGGKDGRLDMLTAEP